VFFFDEAHLLFDGMPKELRDKMVQVVKLIRSKGVGVYFITQSPSDIPDEVLAQLSNKVQHALRAYTPAEQKAVRAAAGSFRENPAFKTADVITELGTGEALVSFLDAEGTPSMVQRAKILPPQCSMGAPDSASVQESMDAAYDLMEKYGEAIDRESAYEMIQGEAVASAEQAALAAERAQLAKERLEFEKMKAAQEARDAKEEERLRAAEEKAAERERIAAEKEAERQRIAAEKEAERLRREAEKKAEREEREAQRKAEAEEKARLKAEEAEAKKKQKLIDAALTSASRAIGSGAARGLLGILKKL
jgi:flagellar biosynthesis GTPase FlhF